MAVKTYHDCSGILNETIKGSVRFIDFGCKTGECTMAYAETMGSCNYMCIEASEEMRRLALNMMQSYGMENYEIRERFENFEGLLGIEETYIINMSCYFADCSAAYAERLASNIMYCIRKHPEKQYILIVQYPENDSQLNPYKVFRNIIEPYVIQLTGKLTSFSFISSGKEYRSSFRYDVFTMKH